MFRNIVFMLMFLMVVSVSTSYSAQAILNDGDTMGTARTNINDNFTELYARDLNTDDQTAAEVNVDVTNFDGILSATDTTVQVALETLDDATGSGSGDLLSTNNLSDLTDFAVARTNLGLAIGTDVQAFDTDLANLANTTAPTSASLYYFDGTSYSWTTTLSVDVVLADEAPASTGQVTYNSTNTTVRFFDGTSEHDLLQEDTAGTSAIIDASGFAGNLATTDDTVQELAVAVDGLATGATVTYSGTATLGTAAIASGACDTVVTVAATGIATTDAISWSFNADPTAVTGYEPVTTGMLTIIDYPTADAVNFKVCNMTAASITPSAAVVLNWVVVQ